MWTGIQDFPFFGRKEKIAGSGSEDSGGSKFDPPVLGLSLDRKVYRPGEAITATVEISTSDTSILVEELWVELRGTEKLDQQWIVFSKPPPTGKKLRRGERVFLESRGPVGGGAFVEQSSRKSYLVQVTLPKVLPPSYRGTAVRYFYYLTARVRWKFISTENGLSNGSVSRNATVPLEKRISLTVWTLPNYNGLTVDEFQVKENCVGGLVPASQLEVEMQWKENDSDSEWSRTSDVLPGFEDDVSSAGSESVTGSPMKGSLENTFDRIMLQSPSMTPRGQLRIDRPTQRKTTVLTASLSDPQLDKAHKSAQKLGDRTASGNWSPWNRSATDGYRSEPEDDSRIDSPLGAYMKGKAYNIRLDDEIVARVSPKNPDGIYCFGDTVAGVVSFPDDIGLKKCLEVSVVLEVREILNPSHLHPSRRNSQVITKVQSEYHEVVADFSQTHYLFSIPLDGPASFSTQHLTVQWILRFEFLATSANVDRTKHAHPLQVKERERGEWSIPITVHAPLPRTLGVRKERPVSSLRDFWLQQSPRAPLDSPSPLRASSAAGPSNGHL